MLLSPSKSVPYCGHYAKGRCKFGKRCKYSHNEQDSPARKKMLQERLFQLSIICVICGVNVVESGHWFGLSASCSHPFCYPCAERKSKENGKKSGQCPECTERIAKKICPSGLFLDGKPKEKALEYYAEHEYAIWSAYLERNRRTARCGFDGCSYKILLVDGTEVCCHGAFNRKIADEAREQKELETERRVERDLRNASIRKTARIIKKSIYDLLFFALVGCLCALLFKIFLDSFDFSIFFNKNERPVIPLDPVVPPVIPVPPAVKQVVTSSLSVMVGDLPDERLVVSLRDIRISAHHSPSGQFEITTPLEDLLKFADIGYLMPTELMEKTGVRVHCDNNSQLCEKDSVLGFVKMTSLRALYDDTC